MNLFELTQDYKQLKELLESDTELINEETEQALSMLKDALEVKIQNCINLIKGWGNDIDSIDKELKRLQKLKKTKVNAVSRIKDYVLTSMVESGNKKIDLGTDKVTVRNNAEKVIISDDTNIPKFLKQEEIVVKIDKNDLKNYVKEHGVFDGVSLVREQSIMIK